MPQGMHGKIIDGKMAQSVVSNRQCDTLGDRVEFDRDFSGRGKLYIGKWDNKLHLYGAEWGVWLVDDGTYFGSPNAPSGSSRLVAERVNEVVHYKDTNGSGFFDLIEYDYNGDRNIDLSISLLDYGSDEAELIVPLEEGWYGLHEIFKLMANKSWDDALVLYRAIWRKGLTDIELDELSTASSTWEKYSSGYWLKEKIFRKLYRLFDDEQRNRLKRYYFTGNYESMSNLILEFNPERQVDFITYDQSRILISPIGSVNKLGEITVINTISIPRVSEAVSLISAEFENYNFDNIGIYDPAIGKYILSQCVDNSLDGVVDELVFQVTLLPLEKRKLWIVALDAMPNVDVNTITFGRYVPERSDDFAWENDLIAFRVFGPALWADAVGSGVDCWLKSVEYPIINKWYADMHTKSYHTDWGEGYDPYHVGKSAGCGGLSVYENGKYVSSNVFDDCRIITNGPIRTIFELEYNKSWKYSGKDIVEAKRITIDAGERLCRFQSTFNVTDVSDLSVIAVGLTTHNGKADAIADVAENVIYCREIIDGDYLWTAVILDYPDVADIIEVSSAKPDESHIYLHTSVLADATLSYYTGFAWQRQGQIVIEQQWIDYLSNYLLRIRNPIKIEY